ncbi:MAG: hypothetical protein E5Y02_10365 [Mesorhizobium sp.]|nr:MAG: hypothetical protein E5Y02_10365 [Mesorhizobium sp.]
MNQLFSTPIPTIRDANMATPMGIDPDTHEVVRIPSGAHRVVVTGAQRVQPPKFDAYMLLNYMIITNPLAGAHVIDRFYVEHSDERIRHEEYQRLQSLFCVLQVDGHNFIQNYPGRPFDIKVVTVGRTTVVERFRMAGDKEWLPLWPFDKDPRAPSWAR